MTAERFEVGLAHLRAYVERDGHARVPVRYITDDGYPLGTWVSSRRRDKASLSAGRREMLEALPGWTWDPIADDWREGLAYLRDYVEREGHARVPYRYVTDDGYPLGTWVMHRRTDRGEGDLPDDRVAALGALPGWTWDPIADDWREGLAHLRAYVEREGHARVPKRHATEDGYRLGIWVSHQRTDHRKGRLTDDRVAVLGALPGWSWDPIADDWREGLAHLRAYVEREGDARVPARHVTDDGYPLGPWVRHRRMDRGKGTLPDDWVAVLGALPGWTWDPFAGDWREGLAHLRAYVEREGHARVPTKHATDDGYPLGTWVASRRTDHHADRLPDDRVAALGALPGWTWDPYADDWQEGLAHLRAYVEIEGHARVPARHVTDDGYQLGPWVSSRRTDHRKGRLTDDRVAVLGALPGWTWSVPRRPGVQSPARASRVDEL